VAVGQYSKDIFNLMSEYELIYKNSLGTHSRAESDIPTVIIIDRGTDFVSPLLTPLTYEAMLDEIFGIRGKTITFEADVTGNRSLNHVKLKYVYCLFDVCVTDVERLLMIYLLGADFIRSCV